MHMRYKPDVSHAPSQARRSCKHVQHSEGSYGPGRMSSERGESGVVLTVSGWYIGIEESVDSDDAAL